MGEERGGALQGQDRCRGWHSVVRPGRRAPPAEADQAAARQG